MIDHCSRVTEVWFNWRTDAKGEENYEFFKVGFNCKTIHFFSNPKSGVQSCSVILNDDKEMLIYNLNKVTE